MPASHVTSTKINHHIERGCFAFVYLFTGQVILRELQEISAHLVATAVGTLLSNRAPGAHSEILFWGTGALSLMLCIIYVDFRNHIITIMS